MSQTFDIKRFGKLVKHDLLRCLPTNSMVGAIMISSVVFTPFFMLMNQFMDNSYGPGGRLSLMVLMSTFIATQIPMQLYTVASKKQKKAGIYFAMLPASKCEKYLSMVLLSLVIAPLIMMSANLLLDSLLTTVHFPGYRKYLWQTDLLGVIDVTVFVGCSVAVVGAVLGFIYVNALNSKVWRTIVSILLWIWLYLTVLAPIFLDYASLDKMPILLIIIEVMAAALMGWLGWSKMNKMGY